MPERKVDVVHYNRVILVCFFFAVVTLGSSFLAEFLWHHLPCRLCKLQRIPYAIMLINGAALFTPRFKKVGFKLVQAALLINILLASYHLLVMAGIASDPCFVPQDINTLENFHNLLDTPRPCSKSVWKLLGIPTPLYNFCISLFFFVFSVKIGSRSRWIASN